MSTIRKRGALQYQARVRIKGYPEISNTLPTRAEARAWADAAEEELRAGLAAARQRAERVTVATALDRYAREVSPDKKSAAHELRRIRWLQRQAFACLAVTELRGSHLACYRDARTAAGIGSNTLRLEFALLSHMYEVARKDWGWETLTNPTNALRKPRMPRGRDRRLQEGEERALVAHFAATGKVRLHCAFVLAIETAMRRSELVQLRWADVDLRRRVANLRDTKNGEARDVPLSTRALAALELLLQGVERDATARVVGWLHPDVATWEFAEACRACGIAGLRLHDLRHEEARCRLASADLPCLKWPPSPATSHGACCGGTRTSGPSRWSRNSVSQHGVGSERAHPSSERCGRSTARMSSFVIDAAPKRFSQLSERGAVPALPRRCSTPGRA